MAVRTINKDIKDPRVELTKTLYVRIARYAKRNDMTMKEASVEIVKEGLASLA